TYTVADANVDHDNVTIDVSGAQDATGNGQLDYSPQNEFAIDTANPTVTNVTVSDPLLTDANTGDTFTVTVTFSEAMDTNVDPTLTFNPAVGSTLTSGAGSWTNPTTFVATYTVADANVDHDNVTI